MRAPFRYPVNMRYVVYTIAQAVWGFPQTLAGACVFMAHRHCPHYRFHGAVVTVWEQWGKGMSLGPFVFVCAADPAVPNRVDARLLVHEYGHTVQSLILGPLYLPVIGLPSVVWANTPVLKRRRHERKASYYAFYPERFANWLGERVLKKPSMGQAVID